MCFPRQEENLAGNDPLRLFCIMWFALPGVLGGGFPKYVRYYEKGAQEGQVEHISTGVQHKMSLS